jgi:hypothetical protein
MGMKTTPCLILSFSHALAIRLPRGLLTFPFLEDLEYEGEDFYLILTLAGGGVVGTK